MPKDRSWKRASGARSVAADSNPGIIVTGDNARIVTNQWKQNSRRSKRVVYGEIPRRPPAFQSRDDLRNQLLNAGQLAIISTLTGTRGIGKSQLAAAYARECIDDEWPLVAWIVAERYDQILFGLDQLSKIMGLHDDTDDSVSAAGKVRHWLESSGGKRCLIVFDNASDPDLLSRWLPSTGSARVVITSNWRSFERLGALIDVEAFTEGEAQAYLLERTGLHDETGANALAEKVGRLPLALAQASAVVKAQRLSYSDFLDRLQKVPLDKYLTRQPGDAYPRGAAETVLLSVQQAERHDNLSRALLLLLSVLSSDGAARELLYSAPIGGGVIGWPWVAGRKVGRLKVDEALARLVEASLVTVSFDGRTVIMHRFTQRVIRERSDSQGIYPLIITRVSRFIAEQCNLGEPNSEQRAITEYLIQHISSLRDNVAIESAADIDSIAQGAGYLSRRVGRQFAKGLVNLRIWSVAELNQKANAAQAIELGTSVIRECQTVLGPDHPGTLTSRDNLATAYYIAGRIDEAIELRQRTLADRERILGPDHPDTLSSRNNLGTAYLKAGRTDEAMELHQRTLADRERILGPDHPDTLMSRGNLASAYRKAGRIDEAMELHQRTLADHERILGPDHPDTLTSRDNLAIAYRETGRISEAIELHQRTLADYERIFGPDHPDTLTTRRHLAIAYRKAGRISEAIELHQRTLADFERIFGPDHPDTVTTRRELDNM